MGYTEEHDAQLYIKRARVLDQLLCGPRQTLAGIAGMSAAVVRGEAAEAVTGGAR
jgi:hypothetical protein